MFFSLQVFNKHWRPSSGTEWSLLTRWRGKQTVTHVTWSVAPLVSVHSWFRLPNPDDFFYPTRTPVRFFIHHFCSLPVYHTVMSVRMVGYCRFVFDVCRTFPCFPNKTSSCYGFNFLCVHLVSYQMFFLFHRCNTYCRSYMGFGTHNRYS